MTKNTAAKPGPKKETREPASVSTSNPASRERFKSGQSQDQDKCCLSRGVLGGQTFGSRGARLRTP
ncbi:MAG TPA: hypothetical protein VJN18_03145, partial [Polyangiaceae bacterium]|nr:hypothetical protein [Polyangiaceae bacterium]